MPENFRAPYSALSVTEFWKRWHITLTDFLRECLYFPLGGSRKGAERTLANILIVYLVSGFWHGNGWTFLIWGLLHGFAQIIERLWGARRDDLPVAVRFLLTFGFINAAWVFFRAPDAGSACRMLGKMAIGGFGLPSAALLEGFYASERTAVAAVLPALETPMVWAGAALVFLAGFFLAVKAPAENRSHLGYGRALVSAAGLALAVLSFSGAATFIYAGF